MVIIVGAYLKGYPLHGWVDYTNNEKKLIIAIKT
jgi:hypothetical protein